MSPDLVYLLVCLGFAGVGYAARHLWPPAGGPSVPASAAPSHLQSVLCQVVLFLAQAQGNPQVQQGELHLLQLARDLLLRQAPVPASPITPPGSPHP